MTRSFHISAPGALTIVAPMLVRGSQRQSAAPWGSANDRHAADVHHVERLGQTLAPCASALAAESSADATVT